MGIEPLNGVKTGYAAAGATKIPAPAPKAETTEGQVQDVSAVKVDAQTAVVAKSSESNGKNEKKGEEKKQPSTEALKKAVENINKNMQNSSAIFGIHEETNRVTIKIVDKETKEVIKELPPEKTLDMIAKAWELAGILVDEKR
ncbi:MAG: flagellar protein FlaG [Lachnospiraceae bacterium]|nr:flagellar protein FlaG [Lachnospiraceae bacterium]